MKKRTHLLWLLALPVLMSSCLISSSHQTTGNPIGTKEGYVKFKAKRHSKKGMGVAEVAKMGGITKIGSVDVYYYMLGKVAIRVTGQ